MNAPVRFVPLASFPRTGQLEPQPQPQAQLQLPRQTLLETPAEQRRLLDQLGTAFREITPALILTGIAIGIASGLGSTIGTAVGTIVVERFMTPKSGRGRRA